MKTITLRTLALALALVTILGLTSAFAATKTVDINKANFPDATFRKYVKQFDLNRSGALEAAELRKVDWIEVSNKTAIRSLKGIEYFTALEILQCYGTSIKTLDVSKNRKLKNLGCAETNIKSLDVRKNSKLEYLDIEDTPLTSIKLGRKDKLEMLLLSGTKLTSVDISGCSYIMEEIRVRSYIVSKGVIYLEGQDRPLEINTSTKVMNGKQPLFIYAKPQAIYFTKASVTLTLKSDNDDNWCMLWDLLKRTPVNNVYATTYTCDKKGIIELDKKSGYVEALKKGTVTVTASSGGKKATIKVTVK